MVTHCATGVRSTVEKCTSHSYDFGLHLSYTRKDVWVKWVAPREISIHLTSKQKNKSDRRSTEEQKL